ncbi:MAG: response regulator [Saccharospirillaceae bacterium]|nr:response regulator [Pseudomonadales bacterium]NRB81471.1 response regulator [Saccharospirillaceae bacterium]
MKIIIYCEAKSERLYYKAICDDLEVGAIAVANTEQFKLELNTNNFHLILLSLHLVGTHSFELAAFIRKQKQYVNTPIVVMTANNRTNILQDAINAKISDVCEKRHVDNLKSILKRMNARLKKIDAAILYVEDDKAVAALTIQTLQSAGITVDWCADIKSAQNNSLNKQYDLLLLDTILKNNESGIDFLLWLRVNASKQNKSIPVLVVSSFNAADRKIQVFNAGADDFLSKPYVEDELLARIVVLIERKQFDVKNTLLREHILEQKRNRFLGTISHDLRAPLNAVLGNLQLLESTKLDAEQLQCVNLAMQSGNMLNDLIQDLLEFSVVEDDQFTLYPKITDLKAVCNEVFNTVNVTLNSKKVRFNMYFDPDIPSEISLDSLRLKQVLLNLLSNASKFTQKGHIDFNIDYNVDNKEVIFHIKDTGKGIDKKDLKRIFDTFTQSDSDSLEAKKGVGLGLSICSRLVDLFKGELNVDSQINKGSHFYFNLPIKVKKTQNKVSAQIKPFGANEYLVLVVDDNKFILDMMRSFLDKINIKCECASNGLQGLKLLGKHEFNAVILDCQMPIMDGYTMAREMRYDSKYSCISIIASSGNFSEQDQHKCTQSGMDLFLPKPVKFDEVKIVLEQAFKRTSLCAVIR